ncbi:hypothetical protein L6164_022822 [Bauhinia variegata]|uniref:Uncharacterized protein n=1 Tax=Bauhinia variegata TaxID=167791 RepID=A0ACB9MJQ4_BAUVA|nr:hypothetical protein L6164_022822 [Bauhinia variegata]
MELISRECSEHSHNPATCMTCVLSDPGAGKADKIGIATIVVNCINIHGHNLTVNMKSLVSKTEDQTLKAACQDCISKYFINKHLLAAAQVAFQNHQHEIAGSLMGQILRFSKACGHYIRKHLSQVPVVVTEEIDLYDELCFHAKSIISDLI